MTGLRPDEPPSYEDTGQFEVAVGQLADPLSDPLPGRTPVRETAPEPPDAGGEVIGSPWFRPHEMPQHAEPVQPVQQAEPVQHAEPVRQAEPVLQAPLEPSPSPVYDAGYAGTYETAREGAYDTGYENGYDLGVAAPPEREPEFDPVPVAAPAPAPTPAPVPPPRRRRGVPGETAQFPVVRPDEVAEPREAGEPDETAAAEVSAPAPGGRAERRKAAKQGAGHRARARGASGSPAGPGAAQAAATAPAVPMTRLEARRAERAAKDSPAVILSRVIGEVFISVGVLMLLFVTYQLWWTNIRAHQQASGATSALQNQWSKDKDKGAQKADDPRAAGAFSPGQGFAIMYIPKLDVKAPIAEGVSKHNVLDKGMIGHYTGAMKTAMPWDKQGNFALAAHRNTHGEPFRYINKLVPGDKIVVETESTYYTYEMTSVLPSTSPSNVKVIQPVPPGSGFTKPGRYITLTTCTPEFTSTYRMIVWGKMVEERPRSQGKPAALPD
ncbi:class E sortase [Streptomyces sp. NPDC006733]|uniref:class E sortase n=1 Tax=Streptomyces sp. NPDC006733 TaxID=3155460 RepID=UPI0033F310E6